MCVCVCASVHVCMCLVVLPPEKAEGCKSFLPSDGERDALKETCQGKKLSLDVSSQQTTKLYLFINNGGTF